MTKGAARRQLFGVEGLWCGGCATGLEKRLLSLPGVRRAAVHFLTRSVFLEWDIALVAETDLEASVRQAGYRLAPPRDVPGMRQALEEARTRLVMRLCFALFFGMWSMLPALVLYIEPPADPGTRWWFALASGVLALPVIGYAAGDLWAMAVRSLRLQIASFDLLIGLGVAASTTASLLALASGASHVYFDAAVMLVSLLFVARLVDLGLRRRALDAFSSLEGATPSTARLVCGGQAVAIEEVAVGTLIVVEAGAEIPLDGIIESGASNIDAAILTGEAIPVRAHTGMRVSAGAVNLSSAIVVRTDRLAGDRDVDRIGGRVAIELAMRPALADPMARLAGQLSALIPFAGIGVAATWIAAGTAVGLAAQHGLATMIVLCPCGFVLARPLAQLAAVRSAAASGIRVANPSALERLATVQTLLFDKTGTLTVGKLSVASIDAAPGWSKQDVINAAIAAETGIDHPIARAILACGPKADVAGQRHMRSASGWWNGCPVRVESLADDTCPFSKVRVMIGDQLAGVLALADQLRPESKAVISKLERQGVSTGVASGDHRGAVDAVGDATGIPAARRHAALTPQDKADLIHRSARPVGFVGDGVNDAPAFAAADVSLAVATAHPAAAVTADIVLSDAGRSLLVARSIGKRLVSTFAALSAMTIVYNLVAALAGAAGVVSPVAAAVLMTINSIATAGVAWRAGVDPKRRSFWSWPQTRSRPFPEVSSTAAQGASR